MAQAPWLSHPPPHLTAALLAVMACKGRGKGKAPAPPPPPASSGRGHATHKPAAALAGPSVLDALASHKFRRIGVETKLTSRSDVEAALTGWVPTRVREANAAWRRVYGADGAAEADPQRPADCVPRPAMRPVKKASFVDQSEREGQPAQLAEIVKVDAENAGAGCPAPWSLGAGVAKAYRLALLVRWEASRGMGDAASWPPLPPGHDPDAVWKVLQPSQRFEKAVSVFVAEPGIVLPPRPAGAVRFVCISDTHGAHRQLTTQLPEGDVLLHAGDFTMAGEHGIVEDFGQWLRSLPYAQKFVIAGNHDLCFDSQLPCECRGHDILARAGGETVTYLEGTCASFRGLRIFGGPWQPEFGNWAFGLQRGPELAARWEEVPEETDVLLVHGPPLGRGDACKHGSRVGCADLLKAVQARIRPSFCVFGHIHEDPGASSDGSTCYVNATSCDFDYRCVRPPLVFDLPARMAPNGMETLVPVAAPAIAVEELH
uniref:Calcineurin-like phosphoesterase domain-containing protein n=1 Tax=Alexandrium catenella TaxID=2925 RepID=A0A7S1LMR8_ALECA